MEQGLVFEAIRGTALNTVLITGANRGLGLGFVQHYMERGWRVIAATRSPEQADGLNNLGDTYGEQLVSVALDVGEEQSIATLPERLPGTELDLLINNAGISREEPFGEWTTGTFAQIIAVNTIGPGLVAQALAPLLINGSRLVNISSGLASMGLNINPENGLDAYSASKAALNMLTRRLAAKLEARDIAVVCLDPGWVQTAMGGEKAPLTVDQSIGAMTDVISGLSLAQSGLFLRSNGEEVPW